MLTFSRRRNFIASAILISCYASPIRIVIPGGSAERPFQPFQPSHSMLARPHPTHRASMLIHRPIASQIESEADAVVSPTGTFVDFNRILRGIRQKYIRFAIYYVSGGLHCAGGALKLRCHVVRIGSFGGLLSRSFRLYLFNFIEGNALIIIMHSI